MWHKPGTSMTISDTLSRNPRFGKHPDNEAEEILLPDKLFELGSWPVRKSDRPRKGASNSKSGYSAQIVCIRSVKVHMAAAEIWNRAVRTSDDHEINRGAAVLPNWGRWRSNPVSAAFAQTGLSRRILAGCAGSALHLNALESVTSSV